MIGRRLDEAVDATPHSISFITVYQTRSVCRYELNCNLLYLLPIDRVQFSPGCDFRADGASAQNENHQGLPHSITLQNEDSHSPIRPNALRQQARSRPIQHPKKKLDNVYQRIR